LTSFSLPTFSRLSPRIARAQREHQQLQAYFTRHRSDVERGDWGALSAVSLGVHNVYNGIEDILMSLARDVDGSVPFGPTMHQDILDQMAAEISGIRPPLLPMPLYEALTELKGFRHLVRHKYGFDLQPERVIENFMRLNIAFADVTKAVVGLHDLLHVNQSGH
jgi:hypothetical protein